MKKQNETDVLNKFIEELVMNDEQIIERKKMVSEAKNAKMEVSSGVPQ